MPSFGGRALGRALGDLITETAMDFGFSYFGISALIIGLGVSVYGVGALISPATLRWGGSRIGCLPTRTSDTIVRFFAAVILILGLGCLSLVYGDIYSVISSTDKVIQFAEYHGPPGLHYRREAETIHIAYPNGQLETIPVESFIPEEHIPVIGRRVISKAVNLYRGEAMELMTTLPTSAPDHAKLSEVNRLIAQASNHWRAQDITQALGNARAANVISRDLYGSQHPTTKEIGKMIRTAEDQLSAAEAERLVYEVSEFLSGGFCVR